MKFQANASMFMRPADIRPSAWVGHIPFAGWIVEALRPRLLVELGTHRGTSFLAFCQAMLEAGVAGTAYAIDTWEGDAHAGLYGPEVYEELASIQAPKYGAFSKLMRMSFDDAIAYFDDGTIDLLHIDGMHTHEAVTHDYRTWLPKMSDRGVVLFHDIVERERDFGVWRLWEEVRDQYPSMEFSHSHGLGVLRVGSNVPQSVETLFSATTTDGGEKKLVQRMFEAAAHQVELANEVERLGAALSHERANRSAGNSLSTDTFRSGLELVRGDIALTYGMATQACADVKSIGTELKGALSPLLELSEPLHSRIQSTVLAQSTIAKELNEQLRCDLRMILEESTRQATRMETLLIALGQSGDATIDRLRNDLTSIREADAGRSTALAGRLDEFSRSIDALRASMAADSQRADERDALLASRVDKIESAVTMASRTVEELSSRRWWHISRTRRSDT